ncbi:MAG: tetratricopeptide repeat protein, partial [Gemmatimonadota bacterium]
LDVVVRNRGVGHNFPAGTTDLWDVWLELRVTDGAGRTVFQSGGLAGGPKGEVDPGAHFFRVLPLDELGRRIDKGNRWDTRTKLYDTTIPAGTADVVHYRFRVPPEVAGPLRVEARLNYRKYRNYFAKWVFGGRPAPGQEELMTATSDPREWILEEAPLPARPIVALARDSVTIPVGDRVTALAGRASLTVPLGRASPTAPAGGASGRRSAAPAPLPEDHLRFNDYGIGLLRQQDLEGALEAFREVVRLDPRYADGYVNLARVHLAAGAFSEAEGALARALELEPGFLKARYFRGLVHFRLGRFEEALSDFQAVLRAFPRDRQVLFQMGRALYVKGDCRSAVPAFHRVLEIDPEDAGAYYNLMLCQRRLGEDQEAAWAEERYETYRLDYDIQQVTGVYRNLHPHESREPEPVHEHRGGRGETPPADGGR